MTVGYTLAYHNAATITEIKSFIIQAPNFKLEILLLVNNGNVKTGAWTFCQLDISSTHIMIIS